LRDATTEIGDWQAPRCDPFLPHRLRQRGYCTVGSDLVVLDSLKRTDKSGIEDRPWIKHRLYAVGEFVIGGYLKRRDPYFDAIIVGENSDGKLLHEKKVRFGFDDAKKRELLKRMERPLFQLLQQSRRNRARVVIYVFDVLNYSGRDLKRLPLQVRRAALDALAEDFPEHVRLSELLPQDTPMDQLVRALDEHRLIGTHCRSVWESWRLNWIVSADRPPPRGLGTSSRPPG
jgi:hypothetical protein